MMGVGSFIVYTFKNTRWVPPSLKSLNSDPLQMPFFVCIFLFSHLNSLIFTLTLPTTSPMPFFFIFAYVNSCIFLAKEKTYAFTGYALYSFGILKRTVYVY